MFFVNKGLIKIQKIFGNFYLSTQKTLKKSLKALAIRTII